jgi:hypothetical protein
MPSSSTARSQSPLQGAARCTGKSCSTVAETRRADDLDALTALPFFLSMRATIPKVMPGAVIVRSDIERKALFGIAETEKRLPTGILREPEFASLRPRLYRVGALAASAWHAHVVSEAGGQKHTNGSLQFFGAASPHLSTRLSPIKTAKAGSPLLCIILSKAAELAD